MRLLSAFAAGCLLMLGACKKNDDNSGNKPQTIHGAYEGVPVIKMDEAGCQVTGEAFAFHNIYLEDHGERSTVIYSSRSADEACEMPLGGPDTIMASGHLTVNPDNDSVTAETYAYPLALTVSKNKTQNIKWKGKWLRDQKEIHLYAQKDGDSCTSHIISSESPWILKWVNKCEY